jgi:short chain dehydrogenase
MDLISDILYEDPDRKTWLIVGASRGIGLEFVRQLLNRGDRVIATVRQLYAGHAAALWGEAGADSGRCTMFICDILSEESIIVRGLFSISTVSSPCLHAVDVRKWPCGAAGLEAGLRRAQRRSS